MQKTPVGLVLDLTTGNRKSLMKDPGNYKSLDQLIIDNSKMTTAEISSATLENSRRQKARDIYNQIKQDVADLNWIKVPPNSEYIPIPDTQIRGDFNKKLPDPYCPRFAEIVDYVHATRDVHSWDTFHFETPEHVLYAHIRRHGVLIISPEEWRDFLIFCSNKNGLFKYVCLDLDFSILTPSSYDYVGGPPTPHLGFVSRNPRGWPSTPIELNFSPPTDFDELCFIQGMKRFGQRSEFFEYFRTKDHNDFDKEIMRNEINICLTYKRVKYNGNKLRGFLAPLAFDQCIAECQRLGDDSWW